MLTTIGREMLTATDEALASVSSPTAQAAGAVGSGHPATRVPPAASHQVYSSNCLNATCGSDVGVAA
jgi:hypothetical protein